MTFPGPFPQCSPTSSCWGRCAVFVHTRCLSAALSCPCFVTKDDQTFPTEKNLSPSDFDVLLAWFCSSKQLLSCCDCLAYDVLIVVRTHKNVFFKLLWRKTDSDSPLPQRISQTFCSVLVTDHAHTNKMTANPLTACMLTLTFDCCCTIHFEQSFSSGILTNKKNYEIAWTHK